MKIEKLQQVNSFTDLKFEILKKNAIYVKFEMLTEITIKDSVFLSFYFWDREDWKSESGLTL